MGGSIAFTSPAQMQHGWFTGALWPTFVWFSALHPHTLSFPDLCITMATNRIAFILTSHSELGDTGNKTGYFLSEVAHPYHVLTDAGFEIDFISPQGGDAPMDPSSHDLDDPANAAFLDDNDVTKALQRTKAARNANADDYDAIYFAGGHGTVWDFPENEDLAEITAAIYENGGAVGAVCHGPSGLVNVKLSDGSYLVDGKTVSCFTDSEERAMELHDVVPFLLQSTLEERGATVDTAPDFEAKVVIDDRLVTGQNPASATGVGEGLVQVLKGAEATA